MLGVLGESDDCVTNGIGHVLQVAGVQSTHVDTATPHQVDVVLACQVLDLGSWIYSVTERERERERVCAM